ncbi:S-layer homology domain-containing protein [Desulfonispora thiosulfatigenes DSM 11270]|uniref:S-layer homology domain-containing protein n=1 Tax=Desulfonispora thiosulfatigenes DSM 11270 TaxID=656914 RepID=A0A1W1V7Z6_DESTI|nr:S-layer homology domain-containing protein [Desulfonispora thiosulfatigenes]SMB89161.1 S-layer homology domain-containing protein [Desulfonispora thiosulfatigenes DSM 11270]
MRRFSKTICWGIVLMFMVTILAPSALYAASKYGEFPDVKSDHWAKQVVTKMQLRQVVNGYAEGKNFVFKPDQSVTKMEAVIMAIRLMELKETDVSEGTYIPFTVPDWAKGAAKAAVDKGIIKENDFKGTEKASREWITRLLIRMVDKDNAAELATATNDTLSFTDTKKISKEYAPYVKLAVKLGLARGNTDNTFAPNTAVTRAQMVAFLSRTEDLLEITSPNVLIGEVTEIIGDNITIVTPKGVKYTLVYDGKSNLYNKEGKIIEGKKINVENWIYTIVRGNTIEYLEMRDKGEFETNTNPTPTPKPELDKDKLIETKGSIISVKAEEKVIFVKMDDGNIEKYSIDSKISLVDSNNKEIKLADLSSDDRVELYFTDKGELVELSLITNKVATTFKKGTIHDIVQDGSSVLIKNSDGIKIYSIDKNTTIKIGTKLEVDAKSLKSGDEVEFTYTGSMLDTITVTNGNFDDASKGKVISINDKAVTYENANGDLVSHYLSTNVKVIFGDGNAKLGDIKPGDTIEVKLKDKKVTEISVPSRNLIEKVTGKLEVDYGADGIIVIADANNNLKAYKVDSNTDTKVNGYTNSLYSLKKGMSIEIEVRDERVIYLRANY